MPDGTDIAWSNHARQRWEERYGNVDAEDALADSVELPDVEARKMELEARTGQWYRLSRKYGIVFICGHGARGDTLIITILSRREKTEFLPRLKFDHTAPEEPVAEYWPTPEPAMATPSVVGKILADPEPEIDAMRAIAAALKPLDEDTKVRVLRWALDRYVDHPANGVARAQ